jgi:hypothetical protein
MIFFLARGAAGQWRRFVAFAFGVAVLPRDLAVSVGAVACYACHMSDRGNDDQYSDEETERRATEALRRALTTPPKPQKELVGKVGRGKAKRKRPVKSAPKAR